jgi:hypothetical protein
VASYNTKNSWIKKNMKWKKAMNVKFFYKIKFFNINFLSLSSSYLPQAVWLHLGEKDQSDEVCWEDFRLIYNILYK